MTLLVLGVLVLIPGPVVGGVDEEGVLTQAEILEGIEQAARLVIEFLHHVAVEPALGFSAEAVGGIDDGVHHGMGQVEREGLLGIALFLEELDRLVGVQGGQSPHVPARPGGLVVLVELDTAPVIRAEGSEVIIKSLGIGHPLDDGLAVGNVPLADAGSLVAGFLHEFSKGDLAGGHPPPFASAWVATREQGRTGRPAHGLRVEGSEEGTFLGQLIEPRSLVGLAPVAGQIPVALVIGKDDDDVGLFTEERKAWKKKGEGKDELFHRYGH